MHCARGGLDTLLVTTSLDTVYTLLGDRVILTPSPGTLMSELYTQLRDDSGSINCWDFQRAAKYALEKQRGLHLLQSSVTALRCQGRSVVGVATWEGVDRAADQIALCVGSFLKARLTVGRLLESAGRLNEMAYDDLYLHMLARDFRFQSLELSATAAAGGRPYRVTCQVLAPEEHRSGRALVRLDNLYAAGVCLTGYLPFEAAAEEGLGLADELLALRGLSQ